MRGIEIKTGKPYRVMIKNGLLSDCGRLTAEIHPHCRLMLVSDDIVFPLYGEKVKRSYQEAGFAVHSFIFSNGEHAKTMDTVTRLLEKMAGEGITRSDVIVALGGGVTGDIAGFVAAIYLRGISYVQIPTTFLAAIDSSVGGKTGVNLTAGKNLTGAFHQPIAVFCDPGTFATLPPEIFRDGLCEAVKYGCIASQALFDTLSSKKYLELSDIVAACVKIKCDIVERDEFDRGERQLLNFGHTPGHAIEKLSGYTISHGHAVGIGMVIMGGKFSKNIRTLLNDHDIDTCCPYSAKELAAAALSDKKRNGGRITLVLLENIGKACLKEMDIDELEAYFSVGLEGTV